MRKLASKALRSTAYSRGSAPGKFLLSWYGLPFKMKGMPQMFRPRMLSLAHPSRQHWPVNLDWRSLALVSDQLINDCDIMAMVFLLLQLLDLTRTCQSGMLIISESAPNLPTNITPTNIA